MIQYDIYDYYKLEEGSYEMLFSPQKDHLVGFEIFLDNQPSGNNGQIDLEVQSESGELLDTINIDLSKVPSTSWYKTYLNAKLLKGKIYKMVVCAKNCETAPYLPLIDGYNDENIDDGMLIGYAYAESTFSFHNKILICLFIISVWLFSIYILFKEYKYSFVLKYVSFVLFFTAFLSWNYMYNSVDNQNSAFGRTVDINLKGVIEAEKNGVWFNEADFDYLTGEHWSDQFVKFGLGKYDSDILDLTDSDWNQGYSRNDASIIVVNSDYQSKLAMVGNYIRFKNGDYFEIDDVYVNEWNNLIISLNTDRVLNSYKFGDLKNAIYCNSNKEEIAPVNHGKVVPYLSQVGVHGKIFRHISRYLNDDDIYDAFDLICCLLSAFVFSIIVLLLYKKYNMLLAGMFLISFWLSPAIINMAGNQYFLVSSWFAPMAVGLFCSLYINDRKCRIISYFATFLSILFRCLCGYEFITTIMLSVVSFLLIDFFMSLIDKNKSKSILLLRTVIIVGFVALLGFVVAICIHGQLRGAGNISEGIRTIIEKDALRRTTSSYLNDIDPAFISSLNASVWETLSKYFHFDTDIIVGIPGKLFSVICIVPIVIFVNDIYNKKPNYELMLMYVVMFVTSISWYCLAKGHSYIHTFLCFALWFFGYVQICLYIIVNKIWKTILKK